MQLLSTLFCAAMRFSSANACASDNTAGNAMGWLRAMLRGTMASISARLEAAPMTDSMWRSPSA